LQGVIARASAYFWLYRGRLKTIRRRWLRALRLCPDCGGPTRRAWAAPYGEIGRACIARPQVHAFVAARRRPLDGPEVVSMVVDGYGREQNRAREESE